MDPQFFAQFADLGITGVFLGYLLWKDKAQTKALADFVDRLLEVLATVEKEREEGFDKVRDRYDEVIAKYDADRDELLLDISSKLEDIVSHERNR